MSENKESIEKLAEKLRTLDNKEGYKLEYKKAIAKMEPTISEIAARGEETVPFLERLLKNENTWACHLALMALGKIKSQKATPALIAFLKEFGDGDEDMTYEQAMFALTAIEKPAIEPLINEIRVSFERKQFPYYMVGALTEIKDDKVYNFMRDVCEDFLKNEEKYEDWFHISALTHDFDKQGKIEAVNLMKRILKEKNLDEHDTRELKDTIKLMEDPEGYRKESKEVLEAFRTAGSRKIAEFVIEEHDVPELNEFLKNPDNPPEKYKPILIGWNLILYLYLKNNPKTSDREIITAFSRIKDDLFFEAENDDSLEGFLRSDFKQMLAIRKIHGEGLTATEMKTMLGKYIEMMKGFSMTGESFVGSLKENMKEIFGEKNEKGKARGFSKDEAKKAETIAKEALNKSLVSLLEPSTDIPQLRRLQSDNKKTPLDGE